MENIAPSMALLLCLKQALEKGFSVKSGIEHFINTNESDFRDQILAWYQARDQGYSYHWPKISIYRKSLIDLVDRGLNGESIYNHLCSIEPELISLCEDEITKWANNLPLKLLIPLLFFQFPAFLLLLFGPLLKNLLASFY